jgi:3-(3-hydroxy-phenyl)propionate hydroxylase
MDCPVCPFVGTDPRDTVPTDPCEQLGARWATISSRAPDPEREQGKSRSKEALVDIEAADDQFSRWLRRAGARTGSVIVLRPDKLVLSVTNRADHERAAAVARRQLAVGAE